MSRVVMALSGGMDSTSLLLRMLARGCEVTCISYNYGQKHVIELDRASANVDYLRSKGYAVEHFVADLSSAMSLFDSTLTDSERLVPEGHYEEEQMKQTVVPNRNAIFSSILYGYALSVSAKENVDALMRAFETGNWGSERVTVNLPYVDGDKESILRDAIISCDFLGLDFDTVFSNTNTSYSPDELGRSSGKTGADVERILAFHAIGRKDPVQYVEDWDAVLEHAIETERQFEAVL